MSILDSITAAEAQAAELKRNAAAEARELVMNAEEEAKKEA